ncbi:hypothetical protein LguiA_022623 [Lonicera macranthoides]
MAKMGRKPWYDKNGMKKGAWSKEEDDKLSSYIQKFGHWNWRQLPKFAGLSRCGKSCRLRWLNYLQQNIKRGNFSKEEEDLVIRLQEEHGNKWAKIAKKLPGRTDSEVKNYWHSNLKKQVKQNSSTSKIMKNSCKNSLSNTKEQEFAQETVDAEEALSQLSSEGYSNFSGSSSNGLYSLDFDCVLPGDSNWSTNGNSISSVESYSEPFSDQMLMQRLSKNEAT